MRFGRNSLLHVLMALAGAVLLSSCTVNFITDIKADGSGLFTQEYILTEYDISSTGHQVSDFLCRNDLEVSHIPPNTVIHQEKRGSKTSCSFETHFASLDELNAIYTRSLGAAVTRLRVQAGELQYDVTLDLEGLAPSGFSAYWIVKMPGMVSDHNAGKLSDSTLTWELMGDDPFNVRATSTVGGLLESSRWIWSLLVALGVVAVAAILGFLIPLDH